MTTQRFNYTIDHVLTLVMYYAPLDKFLRSENELPDLIQYLYVKLKVYEVLSADNRGRNSKCPFSKAINSVYVLKNN